MPLFFDTNIPIGFIFKWDPWHDHVLKVFENDDTKYWSKTVENETYKKFKQFKKKYSDLLHLLWHTLRQEEGFTSRKELLEIAKDYKALDNRKRRKVIHSIWDNAGLDHQESNSKLVSILDELISDFNSDCFIRKKQFKKSLKLHIRMKKYPEIKTQLKKRLHYPDYDIIIDAHDLCSKIPDLEIVTADGKLDINCIKSQTQIKNITIIE